MVFARTEQAMNKQLSVDVAKVKAAGSTGSKDMESPSKKR